MKAFADLYRRLDDTTCNRRKVDAMAAYFRSTPAADAVWAVRFLMGRKPRRGVSTRHLIQWAAEAAGVPDWLFEASRNVVGDLAEAATLLLPAARRESERPLHEWIENRLLPLGGMAPENRRNAVLEAWEEMGDSQRLVWNKLVTGGVRVGVSQGLVVQALEAASGVDAAVIAHRLAGERPATAQAYREILSPDTRDADISRPYPFCLACPLVGAVEALGPPALWQAEWKWDGIRAQAIRRGGRVFIWSRGEELVTGTYPEIAEAAARLPDGTVLDGEIVPWKEGRPLPVSELQRRIGRKAAGKKLLQEVPTVFLACDLLESDGKDRRGRPLAQRRETLSGVLSACGDDRLILSALVEAASWEGLAALRAQARQRGAEGFVLKRRDSVYGAGRHRGGWWKWKVDPFSVDAVLVYAQRGRGGRAGLCTDYTFALRRGEALVPFARAYSGLSDAEIREVHRFIRHNTVERFGPVRAVRPELVFEIAFEGIRASSRHKSGVAVRFPRIARWRRDKKAEEADALETLTALSRAK